MVKAAKGKPGVQRPKTSPKKLRTGKIGEGAVGKKKGLKPQTQVLDKKEVCDLRKTKGRGGGKDRGRKIPLVCRPKSGEGVATGPER